MRRYKIEIDGRRFVVDVQEQDGGTYAVAVDGQDFQVGLAADEEVVDGNSLLVAPAAATPALPAAAASAPAARTAPKPTTAGAGIPLKAPMPGVMLRVLVAPGARVQRGQDLAVLEAMKMENILRAPADATVLEVCVQPGQQLAHDDVILRYGVGSTPGTT